jgi:hypothetical protein
MDDRREIPTRFSLKGDVKRALGKPTCRWKDNSKLDLEEMGWEGAE